MQTLHGEQKGVLSCKGCGNKFDKDYFTSFLQSTDGTHMARARCDGCFDEQKHEGWLTCQDCDTKGSRTQFKRFLDNKWGKTNISRSRCDVCYAKQSDEGWLMCQGCDTKRDRAHFTKYLENYIRHKNVLKARCDECIGKETCPVWTCKICQGVASATVSFTEFRKTANSRKNPRLACCDKCWHLWARCINCKTMWPKDEFNIWMDEMPSRRRTGKTKWMRCNTCMRENRDAATLQSRHDVSEVMKKRRRDT